MTNNTLVSKEMEKHLKNVKAFAFQSRSKSVTRPILTTALVTEHHIIATDSHRLVRFTHNEDVQEPYIHHFNKYVEEENNLEASSYPDTSRLIPNPLDSKHSFTLDVNEWLEAHETGLVASKEHERNNPISLANNKLSVKPALEKFVKKQMVAVPVHEQVSFNYTLDSNTGVEDVTYNCKFMIDALKLFKKYKYKTVEFHFYGSMRPFLLVAGVIEVIILPIRMV